MHLKNKNKAFTVMELLVVITLIIIMIAWASNINFNSSTSKQRLEIFTNKVISQIETIRTNDLVWKAELNWVDLEIPDKWIIEVSSSNSWSIITKIEKSWTQEVINKLELEQWYSISEITCSTNNWTPTTTNTWTIIFEKWNYIIDWIGCNSWENTIRIKTKFLSDEKNIYFDSVNWLITKD